MVSRLALLFLAGVSALEAQTPASYWISDGYGTLLELRGDEARTFEITSISCIPGVTADHEPGANRTTFKVRGGPASFELKAGQTADQRWLSPVFSDVLGRRLPNGWRFGLPNERFLTADGVAFDGPGVPPDIEVPVFTRADLDASRDGALERALAVLGEMR